MSYATSMYLLCSHCMYNSSRFSTTSSSETGFPSWQSLTSMSSLKRSLWFEKPGHVRWLAAIALCTTLKSIPQWIAWKELVQSRCRIARLTIVVILHVRRSWLSIEIRLTWALSSFMNTCRIGPDMLARISSCNAHTIHIRRINRVLIWADYVSKNIWSTVLVTNGSATYFGLL